MNLDFFLAQILRTWRDIGGEVINGEICFFKDIFDRLAAKYHFHRVLRRKELSIHRWNIVVVNIIAVFCLIFPVHY